MFDFNFNSSSNIEVLLRNFRPDFLLCETVTKHEISVMQGQVAKGCQLYTVHGQNIPGNSQAYRGMQNHAKRLVLYQWKVVALCQACSVTVRSEQGVFVSASLLSTTNTQVSGRITQLQTCGGSNFPFNLNSACPAVGKRKAIKADKSTERKRSYSIHSAVFLKTNKLNICKLIIDLSDLY